VSGGSGGAQVLDQRFFEHAACLDK